MFFDERMRTDFNALPLYFQRTRLALREERKI